LKTIIRLPAVLHLISLAALSACGGGSRGSDAVSEAPPLVEIPAAPPAQAASDVHFTVDNSIAVINDIAPDGGRLVLEVSGGATFTLDLPAGAFFAPSTAVSMQSIVDTQGLPPGLTPVAAVNLGPSGADFAVEPVIDIDLGSLPRPLGNIVLFLANDDGFALTYLLPQGDDPIATALGDGPYRARVPHFSGVGVAVSDPNGPGVPDIPDYATTEQRAVHALIRRFDDLAREVLMGQRMPGDPIADIEPIVLAWLADLHQRAVALEEQTGFDEVRMIANEFLRLAATSRDLGLPGATSMLDSSETGSVIIRALGMQIDFWNERCIAGNANAPGRIAERTSFLRNLEAAGLISESTLSRLVQPNFCISTGS